MIEHTKVFVDPFLFIQRDNVSSLRNSIESGFPVSIKTRTLIPTTYKNSLEEARVGILEYSIMHSATQCIKYLITDKIVEVTYDNVSDILKIYKSFIGINTIKPDWKNLDNVLDFLYINGYNFSKHNIPLNYNQYDVIDKLSPDLYDETMLKLVLYGFSIDEHNYIPLRNGYNDLIVEIMEHMSKNGIASFSCFDEEQQTYYRLRA